MDSMRGGQPSQRYKLHLAKQREEADVERLLNAVDDRVVEDRRKRNLRDAMDRLKRRIRMKETEKKKDKAVKQVEKGRKDLMEELNQQDKEKKKKKKEEKRRNWRRSDLGSTSCSEYSVL